MNGTIADYRMWKDKKSKSKYPRAQVRVRYDDGVTEWHDLGSEAAPLEIRSTPAKEETAGARTVSQRSWLRSSWYQGYLSAVSTEAHSGPVFIPTVTFSTKFTATSSSDRSLLGKGQCTNCRKFLPAPPVFHPRSWHENPGRAVDAASIPHAAHSGSVRDTNGEA